jgi:Domain of unknown function (DUF4440)
MSRTPIRLAPHRRLVGASRALAATALLVSLAAAPAAGQSQVPEADMAAQGAQLVDRFLTILSQPDEQKRTDLEGFLAPEFQLIRADATRPTREGYIADPASVVDYAVDDLVVTGSDGVIVATYQLSATATIDDVTRTTTAPRLSVFSRHGDDWLIAAHANFSPLAPDADASAAP